MKNKYSSILIHLLIVAAIVGSLYALFNITKPKYFTVSEIIIEGNNRIDPSEIIKRSGIRAGVTSMFFLESIAINNIMENPWASKVQIQKEFPGKITINVLESKPYCIIIDDKGKPHYLSENGKKLGPAIIKEGLDFPVILSDGILYSELLDQAIEILNLSKSSSILNWKEISEVNISQEHGLKLITVDKRLIEFGIGNIKSKWYRVEKIISHARTKNLSEDYINISSENLGVVNFNI
ncbi:MAG: FtsQ-type POTRA domain-containing protein [Candidatus Dadabacteria bacterium]|nr:FtsQ-type POTRA domain-containing protein [Candidatus Dadabacteria bacterium]NIQ15337.1 FtsQ-type POTRA domain-containing protein [Candidatus Dadabacteria bacterium]